MATNIIVRQWQEQGPPANNIGNWSFIAAVRFPQGVASTLRELQDRFCKKGGQTYALNHKTEGKDVLIAYNSQSKDVNKMYSIQLGATTALTEEELSHASFLTDFGSQIKYPKDDETHKSLVRNGYYEWLENYNANSNLKTISRESVPQQARHYAQTSSAASKFDTNDELPPAEPEPAAVATKVVAPQAKVLAVPKSDVQLDMKPNGTLMASAIATPVEVTPKVVAPAPIPEAHKPEVKVVSGSNQDSEVAARIENFGKAHGINLMTMSTEISDTQFYKPGMAVLSCFTQYSKNIETKKHLCRGGCPLRLDCMVTDVG
jgi:hypothetical protein